MKYNLFNEIALNLEKISNLKNSDKILLTNLKKLNKKEFKSLTSKEFKKLADTKLKLGFSQEQLDTYGKLFCTMLFKADRSLLLSANDIQLLLFKEKQTNKYRIPCFQINQSYFCSDVNELKDVLKDYSIEVYSHYYNVHIRTCCVNQIIATDDFEFFIFPIVSGEWTGDPFSKNEFDYVWVDLIKYRKNKKFEENIAVHETVPRLIDPILTIF